MRKCRGAIDLVNRIIQENLTAMRVVMAYVRGEYEISKFNEVNTNLQTHSERAFRLAMTNMAAMQFVMYGTIISNPLVREAGWIGPGRNHEGGRTHRILELCAADPEFSYDDIQHFSYAYQITGLG